MSNNDTSLAESKTFKLPSLGTAEFSSDELSEDMAGLQLNLQKIKIPGSGGLQYEIPGDNPEDPDYTKTLEGVVIFNHASNGYWPSGKSDDENVPPICSSVDGVTGMGNPGGACVSCHLNDWGSGDNGKGKACKNMRTLYLLRNGDYLPIQLSLPPTSIKPWSDFYSTVFASRQRLACGSVVQIGLKRMNNGKDDYSVATFKKIGDFSGAQLAQVKAYADGFKMQIKETLQQRALAAENNADDIMDISAPSYDEMFSGTGEQFSVPCEIDGDRDDLPA